MNTQFRKFRKWKDMVMSKSTELDEKIKELTEKIAVEPEDAELYKNRADIYHKQDNYDNAIVDYTKAIELNPEYAVDAYLSRGLCYNDIEDYDSALNDYTKVIEFNPENEAVYMCRGVCYESLEDYDSALKDYTKVIELNPKKEDAYLCMGNCYSFLELMENYEVTLKNYTKAIEINSEYEEAYLFRGRRYFDLQNYDAALKDYTKTIEINSKNEEAYLERGKCYLIMENDDNALKDYAKAAELNPKNKGAYFFDRGEYYFDLENYEVALKDYTKAIEINPENDNAYSKRGLCYFNLENYDAMLNDCIKAIEINPENEDAYLYRGHYYFFYLQSDDDALENYTKVIEINHENENSYLFRGLCYYSMEKEQESLKDLSSYKQARKRFCKKIKKNEIKFYPISDLVIDSSIDYMLKVMEILLDLKELKFYNKEYSETAKYLDALNFENEECPPYLERFIFQLFGNYPKFNHSLNEVLERDGKELFLIRSKLTILSDICDKFYKEILKMPKDELSGNAGNYFNQQVNFTFLYFNINKALQEKNVELVEKKEREKAQAKIEERNKIIQDLSHSIKNLIKPVIDPLENLKKEIYVNPQLIEKALRGANIVRGIVNAIDSSFKGTIDDFYYDAKHNNGKESLSLQFILTESMKYSVANMFDGKYFGKFQLKYFPTKDYYLSAKSEWEKISQSNLSDISPFLQKYFFDTGFAFNDSEKFVIGNNNSSAINLLILFQEIILNAVKYSAYVNRAERSLHIHFTSDAKKISIIVENSFKYRRKTKTTGVGHVIIENFAKLLNTEQPVVTLNENIYKVKIAFANLWRKNNENPIC